MSDYMRKKFPLTVTDLVVGSFLLLLCLFFAYRVKVGLNYNWAWGAIPQFIYRFDAKKSEWVSGILLTGFYTTIRLSVWGVLLATVFGVLSGIAKPAISFFSGGLQQRMLKPCATFPP